MSLFINNRNFRTITRIVQMSRTGPEGSHGVHGKSVIGSRVILLGEENMPLVSFVLPQGNAFQHVRARVDHEGVGFRPVEEILTDRNVYGATTTFAPDRVKHVVERIIRCLENEGVPAIRVGVKGIGPVRPITGFMNGIEFIALPVIEVVAPGHARTLTHHGTRVGSRIVHEPSTGGIFDDMRRPDESIFPSPWLDMQNAVLSRPVPQVGTGRVTQPLFGIERLDRAIGVTLNEV